MLFFHSAIHLVLSSAGRSFLKRITTRTIVASLLLIGGSSGSLQAAIPTITSQPRNLTVTAGQPATFSVSVTGTGPFTYQWSRNYTVIFGATSSTYTIPATVQADNGSAYMVTVTNLGDGVQSSLATLTVNAIAPAITTQPSNKTVTAGATATFSVTVSGTAPLTYQWSKNGSVISGANSASYTTPATTPSDHGSLYKVVVSNAAGNATSTDATLTVNVVAPTITTQPSNKTVSVGTSATFNPSVSGTSPLTYQWRKNGISIPGANSRPYTTPITTLADNGSTFSLVVSNSAGTVTSNNATLTVNAIPPSIATQPASITVTAGSTASFNVSASGSSPFTYQWKKGGVALSGATSSTYTTASTTLSDTGSLYSVVVSNSSGNATSTNATLTVNAPVAPSITTQPQNVTASDGNSASFSLVASGTAPFTYQWRKNGVAVSGATNSSYSTPPVTISDTGSTFSVVVSNAAGSATSTNALLTVNALAPSITTQPIPSTVAAGLTASFSVVANGTSPLAFQWKKNGVAISGATSSNYSLTTASGDNGATFAVTVSNAAGTATSNSVSLTVNDSSLTVTPASVSMATGSFQSLTAVLDGVNTSVNWVAPNGGSLSSNTGSTVTWTAPEVAGTYTVTASKTVNGILKSFTVPFRVSPPICTPVN